MVSYRSIMSRIGVYSSDGWTKDVLQLCSEPRGLWKDSGLILCTSFLRGYHFQESSCDDSDSSDQAKLRMTCSLIYTTPVDEIGYIMALDLHADITTSQHTLGSKVNRVWSVQWLLGVLQAGGEYAIGQTQDVSDVIVDTTASVRHAEQRVYEGVAEMFSDVVDWGYYERLVGDGTVGGDTRHGGRESGYGEVEMRECMKGGDGKRGMGQTGGGGEVGCSSTGLTLLEEKGTKSEIRQRRIDIVTEAGQYRCVVCDSQTTQDKHTSVIYCGKAMETGLLESNDSQGKSRRLVFKGNETDTLDATLVTQCGGASDKELEDYGNHGADEIGIYLAGAGSFTERGEHYQWSVEGECSKDKGNNSITWVTGNVEERGDHVGKLVDTNTLFMGLRSHIHDVTCLCLDGSIIWEDESWTLDMGVGQAAHDRFGSDGTVDIQFIGARHERGDWLGLKEECRMREDVWRLGGYGGWGSGGLVLWGVYGQMARGGNIGVSVDMMYDGGGVCERIRCGWGSTIFTSQVSFGEVMVMKLSVGIVDSGNAGYTHRLEEGSLGGEVSGATQYEYLGLIGVYYSGGRSAQGREVGSEDKLGCYCMDIVVAHTGHLDSACEVQGDNWVRAREVVVWFLEFRVDGSVGGIDSHDVVEVDRQRGTGNTQGGRRCTLYRMQSGDGAAAVCGRAQSGSGGEELGSSVVSRQVSYKDQRVTLALDHGLGWTVVLAVTDMGTSLKFSGYNCTRVDKMGGARGDAGSTHYDQDGSM
ncbi:hypothetical protein Tco_1029640 [Tanacetum coccineum]|uniref:Uncharacterized protein n=1 Tax=Tanacetum coccineum TaxID=301880 RepID=A0ABQ5G5K0_9ASTR